MFLFKNKINNLINNEEANYLIVKKNVSNSKKGLLIYISFTKIISSYGVIALHINKFWDFNSTNKKEWLISNFYQSLFYYPVPLFVLCIGATLLDFNEKYGLLEYNKKRFIKVFIPLLGWTLILYFYKANILNNIPKITFDFSSLWNYFFLSKIFHIFKSLHIFLLTYMLIPLLAFIEKQKKIRIFSYYFFLLLITQAAIPYLIKLFGNKIVWIYNLDIGYLIYIFAGYIIHNHKFSKIEKYMIYTLGILSFCVDFIGTKISTFKHKKINIIHKGYLNLPCILYSCALFLLIKEHCNIIFKFIKKRHINLIGSLTLGPFFLHFPVIETIIKFPEFNNLISFNILFKSLVIFFICILLSGLLKKIPLKIMIMKFFIDVYNIHIYFLSNFGKILYFFPLKNRIFLEIIYYHNI